MKKILTISLVVLMFTSLSLSTAFAKASGNPVNNITKNILGDSNGDLAVINSERRDDAIKSSDVRSFRGKFLSEFEALKALRTTCKENWDQIKSLNESIKLAWNELKAKLAAMEDKEAAKAIATDLKSKISPLRTDRKDIHAEIKTIRAQKEAEWANFRTAVTAKNEADARVAINNILSLKQQLIDKEEIIIADKQQILSLINEAA